ncbi:MAG: VOC family protein [Gammaproteobacteria bacterium]|nr:VOC family protein [Gammaproteobacteria bacterium]
MNLANIEHVNVTVQNPNQVAKLLCTLFNWKIRWSGESKDNGYSVHVGNDKRYFALYTHSSSSSDGHNTLRHGTLNHVGVVVTDLESMEKRVNEQNLKPVQHRNYGVCRSFYFMAESTLEIEVVSYS